MDINLTQNFPRQFSRRQPTSYVLNIGKDPSLFLNSLWFSDYCTFFSIIDNKIALNTNNDRLNKLLSTCIAHAIHFFKRNVNEVEINYKAYFQKLGREEYYCDIVYQLYSGLRPCMIVTEMFFRLVYFHSIKPLNSIEDLYQNGNIDYFDRGFLNLLIIKDFSDKKKQDVINKWREKLWKLCILFTYDSNRQIFLLNEKYYFTVENIETQMIFTYGIKDGSRFVKLLKEIATKINQQNRFNKHILVFALMFRLLLEVNRAAISFDSNSFSTDSNCEKTQDHRRFFVFKFAIFSRAPLSATKFKSSKSSYK